MGFKLGEARPANAGRKKGTPNKLTQSIMDVCNEMGFDPARGMIEIAMSGETPELQFQARKELLKYLYPQRKAVEHSGTIDTGLQSIIESIKDKSEDELTKIAADSRNSITYSET